MSSNEETSSDRAVAVAVAVASGSKSERRRGVVSSMGGQVERLKDRLRALEEEDHVAKQDFYKSLHEINKLMTEIRRHFHFLQSRVGSCPSSSPAWNWKRKSRREQTSAGVMIRDLRAAMEEGGSRAVCP